ncbi:MAG: FG-GAP repeat domain-containing protein, partial [Candidatus Eiseniibacteriota bacterium]
MDTFRRSLYLALTIASALFCVAAIPLSADPLLKSAYESFDTGDRQNIKAQIQSGPRSVAIGDLNGDGRPDLVVAAPGSNALWDSAAVVSVHLASPYPPTTQPPFLPATNFATDVGTAAVALADMNHDGRLDVVTANSSASTVSVLLGDGTGKFGVHVDATTGTYPQYVAAADLNADGNPDVVTINSGSRTISVIFGLGNGGLGMRQDYATGPGPTSILIAQLNGDSAPDIVVTCGTDSTFISIYLNNGSGGFAARTDVATPAAPLSVAAGLMNGDGAVDLVVGMDVPTPVSVFLGTGTGAFPTQTDYPAPGAGLAVALSDVNNDGHLDAVVSLFGGSDGEQDIGVFMGDGTGALGPAALYDAGPTVLGLACADLDGDG